MPRTAILYARSYRRAQLDRQVRELEDWCDRAGVVPVDTVAEVALGLRASKRCRGVLADVAAGRADLVLIRDVTRLSECPVQLKEIIDEHRHRIALSRDDVDPSR
ncbi:MAG: recombinase family protein [Pseudonocardiales bacterium]|nr:recombinase family protein [Pseudonocardiales bacterium]MBV9029692.1 recombinase family protein [Pseudonocardiales bacterium]MBW0010853.1 recombinase family protein [Pseudonocardiales bacterium]